MLRQRDRSRLTPSQPRRVRARRLLAALALGVFAVSASPGAASAGEGEDDKPATWRFKKTDKPVKVVVLAGSVGEWQKDPFHKHLQSWCSDIDVKNISVTGAGAYQLRKHFMSQVIENRYINLRHPDYEYWLMFLGGLNSVAMPEKTNKEIRQLFVSAHRRGMGVVGLSLMPWGEESDSKRWKGLAGLKFKRYTQTIVDFVLGRSTPQEALGTYRDRRDEPDAPWDPSELADIGVDLYDSPMRDSQAPLRDLDKMRAALEKSKAWQKDHAHLSEADRERALEADAQAAAELPRWYMRKELQAFDDIHPNEKGHRVIAEVTCPKLPSSWNCSCPKN